MCLRALWYDSQDLLTWKMSNDGRSPRRTIVRTLLSVPNSSTENSELATAYTKVSRHWSRESESVNYRCKNLPERSSHIPSFVILHFKCQRSNPYSRGRVNCRWDVSAFGSNINKSSKHNTLANDHHGFLSSLSGETAQTPRNIGGIPLSYDCCSANYPATRLALGASFGLRAPWVRSCYEKAPNQSLHGMNRDLICEKSNGCKSHVGVNGLPGAIKKNSKVNGRIYLTRILD
jgi:hypothetical protein